MKRRIGVVASLAAIVAAVTVVALMVMVACSPSVEQVKAERSVPCSVVGMRDVLAGDPACVTPYDDVTYSKLVLPDRTVQYANYQPVANNDPEGFMPDGQYDPEIRQYKYDHVSVLRFNDRDIVMILVSDRCPVNLWDENDDYNLGCGLATSSYYDAVTRQQAVTTLSEVDVRALETNAERQGITRLIYALKIVTPDDIQPDGSSGADYGLTPG